MLRCSRGTCNRPADAGLGYDLAKGRAWLYDLPEELRRAAPTGISAPASAVVGLCSLHADRTTAPQGWEFRDDRAPSPMPSADPAGAAQPESVPDQAPLFAPRRHAPTLPDPASAVSDPASAPSSPSSAPVGQPEPSLLERAFRAVQITSA